MESEKFVLKVTAGHDYSQQREIQVNTSEPHTISSEHIHAQIHVRIKDFRGLPKSPSLSPYFSHPSRTSSRYSLQFSFTLPNTTNSDDVVFGNDFDHPIRDRLPPMFGAAFKYVRGWVDPGLYGDPYADEPYLYGPALSSVNTFNIGGKKEEEGTREEVVNGVEGREKRAEVQDDEKDDDFSDLGDVDSEDSREDEEEYDVLTEGASSPDAAQIREEHGIPSTGPLRQKHFLSEENRKAFNFEKGRVYKCDFFNGYLDFNDFSLKLPLGLSINVVKHWDGQPLRYVLRNRATGTLLFVVSFTLVPVDAGGKRQLEEQTGMQSQSVDEIERARNEEEEDWEEEEKDEDDDVD